MTQNRQIYVMLAANSRIANKCDLHVMIVDRQYVWYLCKGFPQMGLIKMTRVIVEIGMRDVFFVSRCPNSILASFFPGHGQPLLQRWDLLPQPISIYLATKPKLAVEATTFHMFLHDVFPHETNAA